MGYIKQTRKIPRYSVPLDWKVIVSSESVPLVRLDEADNNYKNKLNENAIILLAPFGNWRVDVEYDPALKFGPAQGGFRILLIKDSDCNHPIKNYNTRSYLEVCELINELVDFVEKDIEPLREAYIKENSRL